MTPLEKKLLNVSKSIYECRACDFHNEIKDKIKFNPDPPSIGDTIKEHRAMVVGINPAAITLDNKNFNSCYDKKSYEEYSDFFGKLIKKGSIPKVNKYQRSLTALFNEINNRLYIYDERNIPEENIFNYIFWSNLSFCPSYNTKTRKVNNVEVSCRIFSEEIHNCLDKNFLANYIKLKKPKIIIFLASNALNIIYYKTLLKKVFNLSDYSDIDEYPVNDKGFPAYERNNKEKVNVFIKACAMKTTETKVIFFPHPNFHFKKRYKEAAIKEICDWFDDVEFNGWNKPF